MEWILKSPQIHSAFASLGHMRGDVYHINDNCSNTLKEILQNILSEDKSLRSFRRTISFGQNVQKDLMPILIHSKDDEVVGLLVKILMNLTIPVECLLSLEVATSTDFGRYTIFELRNLLRACKNAFLDPRASKVVIDFLKNNSESKEQSKLSMTQCEHIHDCLTLLRNVLHVPDDQIHRHYAYTHHTNPIQNQIFWNMFSQGVDKLLIKVMTIPEASNWSATMVQLVALFYKDQNVGKLQKLLNMWLETSLSESSEDNESNTSPKMRDSATTSPMLTTDQTTSDSSDDCVKGKGEKDASTYPTAGDTSETTSYNSLERNDKEKQNFKAENDTYENKIKVTSNKRNIRDCNRDVNDKETSRQLCSPPPTKISKMQIKVASENSDCGYSTQKETRESISTSSNEDDRAIKKPVHIKPHKPKHKANTKIRLHHKAFIHKSILDDRRRKKMVKRGKSNILNVKGLQYHQPSDDDIALVLKEFTVDFMLKGYSSLVKTLHKQTLNYNEVEIDRCHFFWLVTYFLKFATQMELELEHVESVLSFDVVSFLTAEGVNLCEQFERAVKYNKADLNVCRRKLHLVVTAIREFVQAIDTFKRLWVPMNESSDPLNQLQMKMWETDELRSLMVLLIKSYNSDYHDKQYLQDLVVTNHLLLLLLDNVINLPGYTGKLTMIDHIRQFATPHMMQQYGVLLEEFVTNGEFVNDCVFTIMHHVGGEAESLHSLYNANILHAFSSIKQSDYEICDHWTDLVEYVMNSFARQSASNERNSSARVPLPPLPLPLETNTIIDSGIKQAPSIASRWTDDELSALGWNYMHSKNSNDVIGDIVKLYKEDGILKTRTSLIDELYRQSLIELEEYKERTKEETCNAEENEIRASCDKLTQQGNGAMLDWVQSVLLEVCYVKICLAKIAAAAETKGTGGERPSAEFICKQFKNVISPVAYHNVLMNKTIPLVPFNCRQTAIYRDATFVHFLTKLNFFMPVDTGMVFYRIPHSWTADVLYEVALKISNVDTSKLKFSISDISRDSVLSRSTASVNRNSTQAALEVSKLPVLPIPEHCYRVQRFKQVGAMLQYTPTPDPTVKPAATLQLIHSGRVDWMALIKQSQVSANTRIMSPRHNKASAHIKCQQKPSTSETDNTTSSSSNEVVKKRAKLESRITVQESEDSAYVLSESSSKMTQAFGEIPSICEEESMCDTASVASDFSRMYVSDEEDLNEERFSIDEILCDEPPITRMHVHVHKSGHAHMHYSGSDVHCGSGVNCGADVHCGSGVNCGADVHCGSGVNCGADVHCGSGVNCGTDVHSGSGVNCGADVHCDSGVNCGADVHCGADVDCCRCGMNVHRDSHVQLTSTIKQSLVMQQSCLQAAAAGQLCSRVFTYTDFRENVVNPNQDPEKDQSENINVNKQQKHDINDDDCNANHGVNDVEDNENDNLPNNRLTPTVLD